MNREDALSRLTGELRKANGEVRRQLAEKFLQEAERLIREEQEEKSRECSSKPPVFVGVDPGSPKNSKTSRTLFDTPFYKNNEDILDAVALSFAAAATGRSRDTVKAVIEGKGHVSGIGNRVLESTLRRNQRDTQNTVRRLEGLEHDHKVALKDERLNDKERPFILKCLEASINIRKEHLEALEIERKALEEVVKRA